MSYKRTNLKPGKTNRKVEKGKSKYAMSLAIPFGIAMACHSMGEFHNAELIAKALGISIPTITSILSSGLITVSHYAIHHLADAVKMGNTKLNYDLEHAIIRSYETAISETEKEILKDNNISERNIDRIYRLVFERGNEDYQKIVNLRRDYFQPLLDAINDENAIEELLEKNEQIDIDKYIENKINNIRKVYFKNWDNKMQDLVADVPKKFKEKFYNAFLAELKKEDKAKTAYFTHLLEAVIKNTQDIKSDITKINNVCAELTIDFEKIVKGLNETKLSINELLEEWNLYKNKTESLISEIQSKVKDMIQPSLDLKNWSADRKDKNIFDYKYGFTDFVGRTEEIELLWRFIESQEDSIKLSWLLIIGSGGSGKSRLAQHVCQIAEKKRYYSGFYDFENEDKLNLPRYWHIWKPDLPTIIVIDYALSKIDKVEELVKTLNKNKDVYKYPVRLILIDREINESFRAKFREGTALKDRVFKDADSKNFPHIELEEMENEDKWKLIQQVITYKNPVRWDEVKDDKTEILKKIKVLDDRQRPLFVFLYASELAERNDIKKWDTNELLKNTLTRFEVNWDQYFVNEKFKRKIIKVILVNTLCRILSHSQITKLITQFKFKHGNKKVIDIYRIISDHKKDKEDKDKIIWWEGLKPDILGEYFILHSFEEFMKYGEDKDLREIIKIACNFNFENVCFTCLCIWDDFQKSNLLSQESLDLLKELSDYARNTENSKQEEKVLGTAYALRAFLNWKSGYGDAAKSDFQKYRKLDPSSSINYAELGEKNYKDEYYFEAIWQYSKALFIDPTDYKILNSRADAKSKLELVDSAIEDSMKASKLEKDQKLEVHTRAIKSDPDNYQTYLDRGIFYFENGMDSISIRDFNKANELNPEDSTVYYYRSQAYYNMGNSQWEKDFEEYKRLKLKYMNGKIN